MNRHTVDIGYDNLCSSQQSSSSSIKSPTAGPPRTKSDLKLNATLNLHELRARVSDVANILIEHIEVCSPNSESTKRAKDKSFSELRRIVIPFIQHCSSTISNSARSFSPIPSVKFMFDRSESERKRTESKVVSKERLPLRMIQNT